MPAVKLDRLLGITMTLLTKKRVTAPELASRFEVSTRTIYRDIELINQSGIPVTSLFGKNGGFEIMEGFFLTKQHFSFEDFSMIYNLLKGAGDAVGGEEFSTIINKIGTLQPSLLNEEHQDKISFDFSASNEKKELIHPLIKAIEQSNRIKLTYTNTSGQVTERKIEPLNILWEKGIWYLDGYCLLRKDKRYFRVSRMSHLQVLEERFKTTMDHQRPINQKQGTSVHLRFQLDTQQRVFEQFPEEYTAHENFIDVKTVFYSRDYAISVILSYGANVEIVSPESLKDDLIQMIKRIEKNYLD